MGFVFFFQAEDGIRDVERSRGLGDVYKRQVHNASLRFFCSFNCCQLQLFRILLQQLISHICHFCLLYTSDAADDMQCVDLGGRRTI
ncbi:hypothetical protein BN3456_00037 [Clostridium sp. C105KSO13]|nr:hypothetical protein BN3456_00037 [Clostridium sp. C105KSO13]